jgi:sensor histidine kinase regulating citrate/malate metabolism
MEFKNVLIVFFLLLVVSITALSTIPLTNILKKRIEKTSQQRAMTIARNLAITNQPHHSGWTYDGPHYNFSQ